MKLKLVTDLKEDEVIHCPTEEEAKAICKLMHEAGMTWSSGASYLNDNRWITYKKETCYRPYYGGFGTAEVAYTNHTIFSAKDFLQLYKNKPMNRILSRADFKRIHAIACNSWKLQLADKFKDLVFKDEVEIDDGYYKAMRKACTPEQHKLLDEIFGKDTKEVDLHQFKIDKDCIRSGGKYAGKGFVLDNAYTWKIVQDGIHPILIPDHI